MNPLRTPGTPLSCVSGLLFFLVLRKRAMLKSTHLGVSHLSLYNIPATQLQENEALCSKIEKIGNSFWICPQIPTNVIYEVHPPEMVEWIEKAGVCEGAPFSAAGTYQAA
jgi:hypothetical protein